MTQKIANVASREYGGWQSDRTEEVQSPFAEKNYQKHLREAGDVIDDPTTQKALAVKQTKKDIYDALQTLE